MIRNKGPQLELNQEHPKYMLCITTPTRFCCSWMLPSLIWITLLPGTSAGSRVLKLTRCPQLLCVFSAGVLMRRWVCAVPCQGAKNSVIPNIMTTMFWMCELACWRWCYMCKNGAGTRNKQLDPHTVCVAEAGLVCTQLTYLGRCFIVLLDGFYLRCHMYIFNMEDILGGQLRFHRRSILSLQHGHLLKAWSQKGGVQGISKDGGLS